MRRSTTARLIEAPSSGRSLGSYEARNRALHVARGRIVAITDADCRPAPDWLEAGVAALDALEADMVAGRIHVPIDAEPSVAELIDAARHLDQESLVGMGFAAFANFFFRRSLIECVGGFNGRLISNGDREFCMRATQAGFRLVYSPLPVVTHLPRRRVCAIGARCFRMGFGRAQTRLFGEGPARHSAHNWLRPREYVPSLATTRAASGRKRLREGGYEPSRGELWLMEITSLWLVGMPVVAGYLAGLVAGRLRPVESRESPASSEAVGRPRRAGPVQDALRVGAAGPSGRGHPDPLLQRDVGAAAMTAAAGSPMRPS